MEDLVRRSCYVGSWYEDIGMEDLGMRILL